MEAPSPHGALARRGFLTGLAAVCSGCVLSACSSSAAPSAGPASTSAAATGSRTRSTGGTRTSAPATASTAPGVTHRADPTHPATQSPAAPDGGTTGGPGGQPHPTRTAGPTDHPSSHSPQPSPSHHSPTPSPSQTTPNDPGMALAAVSAIPVGGAYYVDQYKLLLTQPTAGDIHAFSGLCTHMGCPVKDVADGHLVCHCHGSQFSLTDGSVIQGPAQNPLPAQKIRVVNGYVYAA